MRVSIVEANTRNTSTNQLVGRKWLRNELNTTPYCLRLPEYHSLTVMAQNQKPRPSGSGCGITCDVLFSCTSDAR
jgi:hypothetical protein